ncbi:mRNA export factor GLE1 isoform X2 [Rhodamnia argentea]|uniref:mRNA export factor GLE1 n=1 Tax=Rhodamnia argentea TaxID=178133 RepID=A0ABM3HIP2_9MYRT|nr:mRNA export factor GLE1 isoform X2 [Rhodamnia argentea]
MLCYLVRVLYCVYVWDRGAFKLELRCPQKAHGVAADPDPDWNLESLLPELDALEKKLNASSVIPVPFTKNQSRKMVKGRPSTFIMRVSDDEIDDLDDSDEEATSARLVTRKKFNFNNLYTSDESDDESALEVQPYLMDEGNSEEAALFELIHEYQLEVKDEIRNQISALETDLINGSEKSTLALVRVEKYRDARRDMDKKIDTQYQRKLAEALDNHLTAIQRDHELKSQIEEKKIKSDAAYEEARRKEKALYEEKLRQEKAILEAEAKLREEAERAATLEAERRAKEAADKLAAEASERVARAVAQQEAVGLRTDGSLANSSSLSEKIQSNQTKKSESASDVVKAAKSALIVEQGRLQKFKEIDEQNREIQINLNKDFSSNERHVARLIRQIRGTKDNVRSKASELLKIFNNPACPQSISIAAFARKVVSHCESPDNAAFACAHVIVMVTSKMPHVMDVLLAEFHMACIFTVPKYIIYSKTAFESKEAYYKALGFREDNGKLENVKDYLKRLESYMRLYGALVQTEPMNFQNAHGLKEGWAWLARFLNTFPANVYTAVALNAFLQMAGFALFRRYRRQFKKMLNVISEDYLGALKARRHSELTPIIAEIQSYIEDDKFLKEPEGRALQDSLLSSVMVPESSYASTQSNGYYH